MFFVLWFVFVFPFQGHSFTCVHNFQKCYVYGGSNDPSASMPLATGFYYNIALKTWSSTSSVAPMPIARSDIRCFSFALFFILVDFVLLFSVFISRAMHAAVAMFNSNTNRDDLFLIGGYTGSSFISNVDHFDPFANIFSSCSSLSLARAAFPAVAFGTSIFVFGGYYASNSVEMFDSQANSWSSKASMLTSRYAHSAALSNRRVFITGGSSLNSGMHFCFFFSCLDLHCLFFTL